MTKKLIINYSDHFIQRVNERCEFIENIDDLENVLNSNFTLGIMLNHGKSLGYLGIPLLNAKIPLKKIGTNTYHALSYYKGIIYSKNSYSSELEWKYSPNKLLNKESEECED